MVLRINSVASLLKIFGVEALAGEKLTVMVGDTVRVHLGVEYRGPALAGEIYVVYGRQNFWFNEDGNKLSITPVNFYQSMDWVPYEITCDVPIGGNPAAGLDLYAKIIGVPGPDIFSQTLLNVLDVMGEAEFQGFAITSYEKV